jgi:hypothetical protein
MSRPVFRGELFGDDRADDLGHYLRIGRLQHPWRKLSNDLAREIADEFSGEQHPLIFLEA